MCDFWQKYRALGCENWLFWIYLGKGNLELKKSWII